MVKQIPKRKKAHSHVSSHIQKDLQNAVTAFTFNTVYGSNDRYEKEKYLYNLFHGNPSNRKKVALVDQLLDDAFPLNLSDKVLLFENNFKVRRTTKKQILVFNLRILS
jgi:hypothetical protein